MKLLCIGAHPDDLEFGCAGTARKIILQGGEVLFLVLTQGERGGDKEVRKREAEKASVLLGVEYKNLLWPDLGVEETEKTYNEILTEIRKYAPDLIVTHARRDKHPDHINTTALVKRASEAEKIPLLYFESFSTLAFDRKITVKHGCDKEKAEALKCHMSQIEKYRNRDIDFIRLAMKIENEEYFEI